MTGGNTGAATASAAVRWFLDGTGERTLEVRCTPGQEPGTVADIVTAVRASRRARIVVAAPQQSGVLDVAVRLAAELGPDSRGLPQVGMGRTVAGHPPGLGKLHSSVPVRPPVVAVKTLAAVLFGGPACDLMIVTGTASAVDAAGAARNAARLMILCPHGDPAGNRR